MSLSLPKFVILTGSERAHGNTDQIAAYINALLDGMDCATDVIHLREHHILPCGSCGECNMRASACHIDDDMPLVISRLRQADGIVYAAPVHGYGMAHPMQIFIERAGVGYLRFERPLANKVAGAVVTGRRYSHEAVAAQLINNILLNRMILVGSGYPAIVHGGSPGAALHDKEGLESIRMLIARMAGMVNLMRSLSPEAIVRHLSPDTSNERHTGSSLPSHYQSVLLE
ncbi:MULTISPECIES: flavodoxin family protein [Achromobacter]|uniref:Flavodoxin family protein n=1 Tax=Achromobacter spanius TaxID=217203 RepID=A0ABY8GMI1_9BURK|nr:MULTISPECIES: flavodoxin family protein [Achromobacter]WAI84919.1 flavodoxin family protein [Achromobacter spanius]WEX95003.1 flavodoxin family protein [Achromobacter sp. SS2-2022]WFP05829.1 flavodoxin family protein [Achromobacter spanius]